MNQYLVIGASSGIGKALFEQLSSEGHRVFGTYFQHPAEPASPNGEMHFLDVRKEPDFSYLPEVLDGVVFCPGGLTLKPFSRLRTEDFASDYDLQVLGAVRCLQALLPRLKKSAAASVVLFSTVAVQTGFPFHSMISATKGAIEGLTRALAAELAPIVRVNAIAPSLTDTPLAGTLLNTPEKKEANAQRHPLKKIGQAKDLSSAARFLLSPDSSWITGQVLPVDGGMSTLRI